MVDLYKVAEEIREILEDRRKELGLYFIEDDHKYFMKDTDGILRSNYPSVSKVLKNFYREFPTEEASLRKSKGDLVLQQKLIKEWADAGVYANNLGSRVHYLLEESSLKRFGIEKVVRMPEFDCDFEQTITGDNMIEQGKSFIEKMIERGAVLLDTEMVMGDPELGYTGQADKVWLVCNDKGEVFIVITDWKTNKPKNFLETKFTDRMYTPFQTLPNTSLGHYYVQLSLYARLVKKMLEKSKYSSIRVARCIVVLLKDDVYEEYKVPMDVINTAMNMDITKYTKKN